MKSKSRHSTRNGQRRGSGYSAVSLPSVLGEARFFADDYMAPSHIQRFAERNRRNPTDSERRFEEILCNAGGGALEGKYRCQFIVHGKWILDFYFPDIRLGVEIDGLSHSDPNQKELDLKKEIFLAEVDITLIRFANAEFLGDPERILQKLREVWPIARASTERRKTI